jgi:hypothetical protein
VARVMIEAMEENARTKLALSSSITALLFIFLTLEVKMRWIRKNK